LGAEGCTALFAKRVTSIRNARANVVDGHREAARLAPSEGFKAILASFG
jgi:hypothetical protein